MKCGALLVVLSLAFNLAALADAKKPATNELGDKVVAYAKSQLGKKVSTGECAELVRVALTKAGAKTSRDYGVTKPEDDYVWGTLVKNYDDVQPGDIAQFRDVKIPLELVLDGKKRKVTAVASHHSSIIAANLGKGKFKVLEQNFAGVRTVRETEWNFTEKQGGTIWIYRPVKK